MIIAPTPRFRSGELTGVIIDLFHTTYNQLGYGFLESVYQRGLAIELAHFGFKVEREKPFPILYRGVEIGLFRPDLIVNREVILEVKTGPKLDPTAYAQTRNYLKASGLQVGLILHFGESPFVRRVDG